MNIQTHRGKININPTKSALLVIDMQNYFKNICDPIKENVCCLIDFARDNLLNIIYTMHGHEDPKLDAGMLFEWWDEHIIVGTEDEKLINELFPAPSEKVLKKKRYSAFINTDLDSFLKKNKIKNLFISGVMTNCCCETTAREAFCKDYRVFFIEDATNAPTKELHEASIATLRYGFSYIVKTKDVVIF